MWSDGCLRIDAHAGEYPIQARDRQESAAPGGGHRLRGWVFRPAGRGVDLKQVFRINEANSRAALRLVQVEAREDHNSEADSTNKGLNNFQPRPLLTARLRRSA